MEPLPAKKTDAGESTVEARGGLAPHRLSKVLVFIDAHLGERMTVAQLAELVHISQFHFARVFKAATGESPHQFVLRRRMERAQALLAAGELSIAAIGSAVGYRTQSHFTGAFKLFSGLPPQAYRRRLEVMRLKDAASSTSASTN